MDTTGFLFALLVLALLASPWRPAEDQPFPQESAQRYSLGSEAANEVRSIAVDNQGNIWAATRDGVYRLERNQQEWRRVTDAQHTGPAFAVYVDRRGRVWSGAWDGLYRFSGNVLQKVEGLSEPVAVIGERGEELLLFGPTGAWSYSKNTFHPLSAPIARSVRAVLATPQDELWIGTDVGLYYLAPDGELKWFYELPHLLSASVRGLALTPQGELWIGGLGGITIFRETQSVGYITPAQGLPSVQVQCVRLAPDGKIWAGTPIGVARTNGKEWSLRHSLRWLPHDDVRDVAFDAEGTAWVATAGGVSSIRTQTMNLAQKAKHYLDICLTRHVREPGLVEKCYLPVPGDLTSWQPRDDDNDGEYTGLYLAMESFRYAVTRDPSAQQNARRAFRALRFLQTVTGTSGFVARTVIPADWQPMNDPNRVYTDAAWADEQVRDPRHKRVHNRWRLSEDGKWLWKGDTSSDEITGHFYGYLFYYDLAADEQDRQEVREHVRRVIDYIIAGGYVLRDIDGQPTRWGVWSPEKLNRDPNWTPERGVNSVEILSFLKAAFHITGDAKYESEYRRLLDQEGYRQNIAQAKTFNPAWRTHIDDELLACAFPALLLYETDPELKELYRRALDSWYGGVKHDQNPWFHFLYASLTGTTPNLTDSLMFLRDAPLDLVRWTVDNTRREDLKLVRYPEIEPWQTDRLPPPSERGIIRWDENPWVAVQGDGGYTESDGVFWLLPYWIGRYYRYILEPAP